MLPEIIEFEDRYQEAFRLLNIEWLDHYHLTESHDLQILDAPRKYILDRGGVIYLARIDEQIVGSAALMKEGNDVYELAKMSVSTGFRQMGISKLLLDKCLVWAKRQEAKRIILFSNHQLTAALHLYEKYGFEHVPVVDSPFETADIKMELKL